jgi:hypothetical protein
MLAFDGLDDQAYGISEGGLLKIVKKLLGSNDDDCSD